MKSGGRFLSILALAMMLGAAGSLAQKLNTKLTKRDVKNIYAQADGTLKSFIEKLNTVSDPSLTVSDLDDIIAPGFDGRTRIFYDEFEVDDDSDPAVVPADAIPKGIRSYLRQWRNFYKQKEDGSIRFDITDRTPIRIGQTNLFLKVYYTETLAGADPDGKAFPKKILKVAEMQVVNVGGQYQTYISQLLFAAKKDNSAGAPVVTVVDKAEGDDDATAAGGAAQYSDAYYGKQLQAGIRAMSENSFTDAFFALREAKNGAATSDEADKRLQELYSKMRGQNQEPNKVLFDGLFSKAQNLRDKYRYSLARKYYEYSREVKPLNAATVSTALTGLGQAEQSDARLSELIDKGAYAEAGTRYTAAIQKSDDNPALYVGLARADIGQGKQQEAEDAFAKAIADDPSYPDTYKWQGKFYQQQKDFAKAYAAYVNYQTRAEDADDKATLSAIAYSKGMLLLRSGSSAPALDSFRAAVAYDANNREAIVAQADVLRTQGDLRGAKALIGQAIARDDQNADAWYMQGQILEAEAKKGDAINAYQKAIALRPGIPKWYFDMGKLQMEQLDKSDNTAIKTFTDCIAIRTASRPEMQAQTQALWKRAKCFYLQGKDAEAEGDFRDYLKRPVNPPDAFFVDYANLLIRLRNYDEALIWLRKAKETPSMLLSLGILNYLRAPSNESGYADAFERAFRDGVGQDAIDNAPNVSTVYENCPMFKSRLKKYKYQTNF